MTNGTLLKRGRVWWWKYPLDGRREWESLKVHSKRDAELVRQERIAAYRRFLREARDPSLGVFERDYIAWAEQHTRPATIAIKRDYWNQLKAYTGAKCLGTCGNGTARASSRF